MTSVIVMSTVENDANFEEFRQISSDNVSFMEKIKISLSLRGRETRAFSPCFPRKHRDECGAKKPQDNTQSH